LRTTAAPKCLYKKNIFRLLTSKWWYPGKYKTDLHKKYCNWSCKEISKSI